jgi:hypothetical protein
MIVIYCTVVRVSHHPEKNKLHSTDKDKSTLTLHKEGLDTQ